MPEHPPVTRGLFITLSNIGDAILSTPALRALHHAHPTATVDIVGDARSAQVFQHCPFRGEFFLRRKNEGLSGWLALVNRLRKRRYDLVVDLRTDGLAWLLRARQRMTKRGIRPAGPHAVQQHLAVVASLSDKGPAETCIWLEDDLCSRAKHRLGDLRGRRILAMGPGARWAPKIWPADRYAEIAGRISDRFDACVLLGDARDRTLCDTIETRTEMTCMNLCGNTGLLEAAALLEQCDAFIGNDSGLGHLAAATGTPTLTVFGPGQPERYHPWGPLARWVGGCSGRIDDLPVDVVERSLRNLPPKTSHVT